MTETPDPRIEAVAKLLYEFHFYNGDEPSWEWLKRNLPDEADRHRDTAGRMVDVVKTSEGVSE